MSTTATDTAAQRAALDKSTLDHPPVAAFVDLVSLIEDGAPADCIRDAVGELRRHGYIVSPPPPRKIDRTTGTTVKTATENPAPTASPESARHDGAVNAKGAGPWQAQPPSLCDPGTASTARVLG